MFNNNKIKKNKVKLLKINKTKPARNNSSTHFIQCVMNIYVHICVMFVQIFHVWMVSNYVLLIYDA